MTRGMLARLAELVYWTGRYVERADDTSRIVDAYIHRIAEDPFGDSRVTCRSLFAILGITVDEPEEVTIQSVSRSSSTTLTARARLRARFWPLTTMRGEPAR